MHDALSPYEPLDLMLLIGAVLVQKDAQDRCDALLISWLQQRWQRRRQLLQCTLRLHLAAPALRLAWPFFLTALIASCPRFTSTAGATIQTIQTQRTPLRRRRYRRRRCGLVQRRLQRRHLWAVGWSSLRNAPLPVTTSSRAHAVFARFLLPLEVEAAVLQALAGLPRAASLQPLLLQS